MFNYELALGMKREAFWGDRPPGDICVSHRRSDTIGDGVQFFEVVSLPLCYELFVTWHELIENRVNALE